MRRNSPGAARTLSGNARQAAADVESLAAEAETGPCLGQSLEAVKSVDGPRADMAGDVADRAAGEDAEFEIMTVDGRRPATNIRSDRAGFRSRARPASRARYNRRCAVTRARRVRAPDESGRVDELIDAADDLVEQVFQSEIGDQHGESASVRLLSGQAVQLDRAQGVPETAGFDRGFDRTQQPINETRSKIGKKVQPSPNYRFPASRCKNRH